MVNKHGMTTLHPSKLYCMFRSCRVNCRLTRDASIAPGYHKRSARRVARRSIANSCLKGRRSTGQAPNALWRPELGIKYLVFQVAFQSCTVCSLAHTCCLSNSFASRRDTQPMFPAARTHLSITVPVIHNLFSAQRSLFPVLSRISYLKP
jgi:hypothetical protein